MKRFKRAGLVTLISFVAFFALGFTTTTQFTSALSCPTCTEWSTCSAECGGGTQTRSCKDHCWTDWWGQEHCLDEWTESQPCNTQPCPCVPTGGDCSLNEQCCSGICAGNGKCKDPTPPCKTEGEPCGGANVCCAGLVCSADPNTEHDVCQVPCTPKTPAEVCPTECGLDASTQSDGCNGTIECPATDPCSIDCQWHWSDCSVACGGGTQYVIVDAEPQYGGVACPTGTQECNTDPCPIDCVWHWSECSALCGGGEQTVVIDVEPQNGGAACPTGTQTCNEQSCEEEGVCPTECGQPETQVPDGQGGLKTCAATPPCDPEGTCPTACGQPESTVPDGVGGYKTCPATEPCDPEGTCPTECGQPASQVPDGFGGFKDCDATEACPIEKKDLPKTGGGLGVLALKSLAYATGVGAISLPLPVKRRKQ